MNYKEMEKIRRIYHLKNVYRATSVGKRKESSAEHTFSCLMLADFLLGEFGDAYKLDKLRVFELLLYHDIVEIESGDMPIQQEERRKKKKEIENAAGIKLREQLPRYTSLRHDALFKEFEEMTTKESRFAKAIDRLDAVINELDHKHDWHGWSEEMLRRYHEVFYKEFPEISVLFEDIIKFVRENGYFSQNTLKSFLQK